MNVRGAAGKAATYLAIAVLAALILSAPRARADDSSTPVAVAARVSDEGETARLTFDLSRFVEPHARTMVDPDRVVVDIPEVNFQIDPAASGASHAGALIKAYRFGLFGPGKSRIVIELARPACLVKAETKRIARGSEPSRLTIEVRRCDADAFAAAAKASAVPPAPEPASTGAEAAQAGPPVIVLDPGHGGVDGGAYGVHGAVEKTIVYDYALELKSLLEAGGRFKVVMTRNGDEFVSLDDRVRIARDANAALLISIHADTLSEGAAEVSGATIYTCSDRASDAESARIAERENAADKAAGAEQKAEAVGVADILFDLKRRETRAYAHVFSRGLASQWQGAGRLNRNPERSAGFVVLKAPDFPSVLVELGYLSNPQDVSAMTSPEWRVKTATAMANAVEQFFRPTAGAAKPSESKPAEAIAASDRSGGERPAAR